MVALMPSCVRVSTHRNGHTLFFVIDVNPLSSTSTSLHEPNHCCAVFSKRLGWVVDFAYRSP